MSLLNEVLAGGTAGACATAIGHPLDCVKVHMQSRADLRGLSTISVAASMLKSDGPGIFFRGIAAPLASSLIINSVMFVAFEHAQQQGLSPLAAGVASGVAQAFLTTPMDWIKIQKQLGATALLPALRTRPLAVMNGHAMNLAREAVFTAFYLGLYTHIRAMAAPADGGAPPLAVVALASSATGALAWLASYPFDVVKSVQQASAAGSAASRIDAAVRTVHKRAGLAGFYRGALASTARAMLVTSSRLVVYESIKSRL